MYTNYASITIDDNFITSDIELFLYELAIHNKLILVAEENFDITTKEIKLINNQIELINKGTSPNLNFSDAKFFLAEEYETIQRFVVLNKYEFFALLCENEEITCVFHYAEAINNMILRIEYSNDSKIIFKNFIQDFESKINKKINYYCD